MSDRTINFASESNLTVLIELKGFKLLTKTFNTTDNDIFISIGVFTQKFSTKETHRSHTRLRSIFGDKKSRFCGSPCTIFVRFRT